MKYYHIAVNKGKLKGPFLDFFNRSDPCDRFFFSRFRTFLGANFLIR